MKVSVVKAGGKGGYGGSTFTTWGVTAMTYSLQTKEGSHRSI